MTLGHGWTPRGLYIRHPDAVQWHLCSAASNETQVYHAARSVQACDELLGGGSSK